MKLNVYDDFFRHMGEKGVSVANKSHFRTELGIWTNGLPLSESLMIDDEVNAYEKKEIENRLGREITQEEYLKYKKLPHQRFLIDQYYTFDAWHDLEMIRQGITPPNIMYDPHLSVEEAYVQYLKMDADTVDSVEFMMDMASDKAMKHVADIRNQYTGDLAAQLGKDKAEYERRAMAARTGDATVITSEFVPEDNGPGVPRV